MPRTFQTTLVHAYAHAKILPTQAYSIILLTLPKLSVCCFKIHMYALYADNDYSHQSDTLQTLDTITETLETHRNIIVTKNCTHLHHL